MRPNLMKFLFTLYYVLVVDLIIQTEVNKVFKFLSYVFHSPSLPPSLTYKHTHPPHPTPGSTLCTVTTRGASADVVTCGPAKHQWCLSFSWAIFEHLLYTKHCSRLWNKKREVLSWTDPVTQECPVPGSSQSPCPPRTRHTSCFRMKQSSGDTVRVVLTHSFLSDKTLQKSPAWAEHPPAAPGLTGLGCLFWFHLD